MSTFAAPVLLTAEEFVARHETERVELVRGVVVEKPMPFQLHGYICATIVRWLGNWAEAHDCGRVTSNDSFIRTDRGPDSVRGADVSYFSYEQLPRGKMPGGLLDTPPDLAVEVRSPSDPLNKLSAKAREYLNAGVRAVVIIDPELAAVTVFRSDEWPQTFHNGDTLVMPDVLPGFGVPLAKLFG